MTSRSGTECVEDGVFREMLGSGRVVVIGVVADLDGGVLHQRPQKDHARLSSDRVHGRRVGSIRKKRHPAQNAKRL
jgi:hypothetical protein